MAAAVPSSPHSSAPSEPPRSAAAGLSLRVLASAAAVALVGFVFCRWVPSADRITLLCPTAGVALACALAYPRAGLAGAALGAAWLNLWTLVETGLAAAPLWAALGSTAGTVVQTAVGAALVRRYVQQPLTLSEPRDIALFFGLGGFVAAAAGSLFAAAGLGIGGTIARADWLTIWLTLWIATTLGVLLGAPVALTLIGKPREEWAPRRAVIGISLLTLLGLLAAVMVQVARLDEARIRARFEREALGAADELNYRLQRPLLALEAMHGVFLASDNVTRDEWRRATESWLRPPTHIQALGWSEYAQRSAVAEIEARARADGLSDYAVRDRDGVPAADGPVMAIRFIEPMAGNATALGINAMSIAEARNAIERSIHSGDAASTGGFRLSQDKPGSRSNGVVVYRALYDGTPATAAERLRTVRGVVFVTLRMDDLLRSALAHVPPELSVCIIDQSPSAALPRRLAGPPACETSQPALGWDRSLGFADRQWTLRIGAPNGPTMTQRLGGIWIVSMVGIGLGVMLGAMLLGMTGRARRIEAAVAERTAALVEEVDERERAEAAMRESEQRFRNIFNNVPIGVVYTDLAGHLQHANPHFCKLSGYAADELQRMDVFDYVHPGDAAVERTLVGRLLRGEVAMHRGNHRLIRRDGETVWVQQTLTLLRDRDGRPRRLVGVIEDITEHLRLVEAERAREQAESANLAKNEFLSRMSHELRTPLNAMLGFAQLLELDARQPLAAVQRTWVAQIQQAGWHLLDMINDVLDLSRIESGNVRLQARTLDLQALIEASLSLVEGDATRRRITIRRAIGAGAATVVGDVTRVKQILINLLSNAVKYNTDGGVIEISTRRDDAHVTLVVRDSGLGMTGEQLAGLFQPFNRLGRERTALEGTGIGLVIARRLAEWMGGSLHAESSPGVGSSFVLKLPLATDPDTVRSDLDPALAPGSGYHLRLVHYIEDNETNVEVMRGMLAQRPQVRMTVSTTGSEAVATLRREQPDVILLDMNLPDIDGLDLLHHLKADPATASIPVIVVSADALPAQIEAALTAGASRYLTKPVALAELLRALDEILDASPSRFA